MGLSFKKVGIFYNPKKREAKRVIEILENWASKNEIQVSIEDTEDIDLAMAIGGDGTVLYTLQRIAVKNIPVVGINTGRLGFLTTVEAKDINKLLTSLENGNFFLEKHPVIKLCIDNKVYYAFNEVVLLKAENTPLISLSLSFNGSIINTPPADGVIIATSSGSTAYALSAGGPVIFPEFDAFEVLPICAHSLSFRPLIFPLTKNIEILLPRKTMQIEVWVDGKEVELLSKKNKVRIEKAEFYTKLIFLSGWEFFNRLKKKLHWR